RRCDGDGPGWKNEPDVYLYIQDGLISSQVWLSADLSKRFLPCLSPRGADFMRSGDLT
ncbi:hypothetical protein CLOSYM_04403, partial [[Clostridium] symbiosum ATCC 14940]